MCVVFLQGLAVMGLAMALVMVAMALVMVAMAVDMVGSVTVRMVEGCMVEGCMVEEGLGWAMVACTVKKARNSYDRLRYCTVHKQAIPKKLVLLS